MNEAQLIDAVNELAAYNGRFRQQLQHAVTNRNRNLLSLLVAIVSDQFIGGNVDWVHQRTLDWFLGYSK
jgi:hypothetical protein